MRHLPFVVAALLLALGASGAAAMELVMFRQGGCPWCAAWDREIGPIYPKTDIGQRLPVRFIDISRARDFEGEFKSPIRFTPTFVLLDGGREIGRIEGYPGQDFFWARLENLVPKPAGAPGLTLALPPRGVESGR
jgi:thioredoxin-related protein